jgi:hypothetical protein
MIIPHSLRLALFCLLAAASTTFAQTVRERLNDRDFHLYAVIFGITVDAHSKITGFKVSRVTEPKTGSANALDVKLPQSFVAAARKKAEAKHYEPKLKNGKPVEFFTYYFFTPASPSVVITELDKPVDRQP